MKGRVVAPAHPKPVPSKSGASQKALLQTVELYRSGQAPRAYAEGEKYLSTFGTTRRRGANFG